MRAKLIVGVVAALLALPAGAGAGAAQAGTVASFGAPLGVNAQAGAELLGAGHVVSGPVFTGDQVVWAQETGGGAVVLRSVPAAGGAAPRTLTTLPRIDREQDEHGVDLQGSPTRLAYFEHQSYVPLGQDKYMEGFTFQARIAAGPPGGPFTTVAGCAVVPACDGHPVCFDDGRYGNGVRWALSGDALALIDHCTPEGTAARDDFRTSTLRRADLAAGTPPAPPPAVPAGGFALTGDLVVTAVAGGALTVRRQADGTSLGDLPALPTDLRPGYGTSALGPDGTFAETISEDSRQPSRTLVWVRPGDSQVHRLPLALGGFAAPLLQVSGGRLLVRAPDGHGGVVLDVVDAATGAVTTPLRLPAGPDNRHAAADVIGATLDATGRVTWAVSRCEHTTIAAGTVTDAPQTVTPAICAGPRIVSRTLTADRRGRFTAALVCGRACSGTLRTYVVGEFQTISTRFRLRGAARAQGVAVRLRGRALARLRRTGKAAITLHVAGQDAVGSNAYILRLRR